jgi:hypothetical protein
MDKLGGGTVGVVLIVMGAKMLLYAPPTTTGLLYAAVAYVEMSLGLYLVRRYWRA